jgi:two-component system, NarL family, nitrate/nitrite response regulator NarL
MFKVGDCSLVLIGQNTLVREGLRRILLDGGFLLEHSGASIEDLDEAALSSNPRLVVLDWAKSDDLELAISTARAAFAQAHVVVLADDFVYESMVKAFNAGVQGFIVKRMGCEPLLASLSLAAVGEKVMPSQLANQLGEIVVNNSLSEAKTADLAELLSDRELETMRYLLGGNPNKVIANHLEVSEATVKVHVKSILRKLGVRNRTQAAIWAVNNGVELGSPVYTPDEPFDDGVVTAMSSHAAR